MFLLQFFGDEDDVDTGETLVQESDGLAVFLRGTFFVKNGCVVPFADTVDDFRRFVAGWNSHEHASRNFAQVVNDGAVATYVDII